MEGAVQLGAERQPRHREHPPKAFRKQVGLRRRLGNDCAARREPGLERPLVLAPIGLVGSLHGQCQRHVLAASRPCLEGRNHVPLVRPYALGAPSFGLAPDAERLLRWRKILDSPVDKVLTEAAFQVLVVQTHAAVGELFLHQPALRSMRTALVLAAAIKAQTAVGGVLPRHCSLPRAGWAADKDEALLPRAVRHRNRLATGASSHALRTREFGVLIAADSA